MADRHHKAVKDFVITNKFMTVEHIFSRNLPVRISIYQLIPNHLKNLNNVSDKDSKSVTGHSLIQIDLKGANIQRSQRPVMYKVMLR